MAALTFKGINIGTNLGGRYVSWATYEVKFVRHLNETQRYIHKRIQNLHTQIIVVHIWCDTEVRSICTEKIVKTSLL